ncbi:uncharacterized protein OCT59_019391 [Rhizophagus irregularis]|uniref:Uncharacterized protein n=5 Tax=Rhizophagus irregularis TaxID=588596 RepID=A0A2N1MSJ5_9GLOM|nr:hypothetical protein RirG_126280 [Rhizophagus irregularis DAOM 197198w]PKK64624.1 hypothetical protein RhiirC2_756427 [Rhizophagus irregularis]UZO27185.1 hypothetical protein OCT59_019391 [Rhizophagus irregularis]GBC51322.1 hypothetical protein GLOIN_2v1660437 [Rhizophagus irregularis DAOM 181602=DAOM 197198]
MIFSSKYINLFVVVLVLVSLLGPFESVSTEKISRRDRNDSPFKEMCKGFKFDNKFTEVRNGEIVEVKWSKGESKMDRIANCEMFGEGNKKFWKQLWTGNLKFDNSKVLTSKIKFEVPKGTKLPTFILLRTWGVSDKGPQCTIVTKKFRIVP